MNWVKVVQGEYSNTGLTTSLTASKLVQQG